MSRLFVIARPAEQDTAQALRDAAQARRVDTIVVTSDGPGDIQPPVPGDMAYRVSVRASDTRLEQVLVSQGATSFHRDPRDAFRSVTGMRLILRDAGLPVPEAVEVVTAGRTMLREAVEALGGLPVIVKVPGASWGRGVMRADSWPGLFSLVDHLLFTGRQPALVRYLGRHRQYRLIVVGDRVVAWFVRHPARGDFRTNAEGSRAALEPAPSREILDAAVRAAAACAVEFAGVDILVTPDGEWYVAEANYPCAFTRVQEATGIDVAGAMLDHLIKKAAHARRRAR